MKTKTTKRYETLALIKLADIISEFNLNSNITESVETGEPFVIIESWHELGIIQRELNRAMSPKFFYKHYIDFLNKQGDKAFESMRPQSRPLYKVPDGLHELEDWVDWGFSDEYNTCGNCGRSFRTSHSSYFDIPAYAILDDKMLCNECVRDEFENEYIESVTNNPKTALKLTIIDEKRLIELGWKEPNWENRDEEYKNGLHEGMDDDPTDIYNTLKDKYDVIFTYEPSQFYTTFWAWTKPNGE